MRKAVILALLLISFLSAAALAQTTDKEWQARAVQKYPELGVQGSDFNNRFVAAYNERRKTAPSFFADPRWPMTLADELAIEPPTPTQKHTPPPKAAPRATPKKTLFSEWNALPPALQLAFLAAYIVATVLFCLVLRRFQKWWRWKRVCADCKSYFALLDESKGLPTVSTTAQLKYNERAFYCAPTALYETLTVQYYGTDVFCCEIAPGMWVGGFQDWSYSREQLTKLDSGTLTITSQRLIFDGAEVALAIPLQRIVSVQPFHDSVDIAFGSGDVNLIFKALNPLILASVIRLSCGGYDDLTRRAEQARQASAGNGTSSNGAAYYSQPPPPPPNPQPKKSRERPAPEIPKIDCEDLIHARTLGLSGKFDFAIVKKHYYDRIREYHPDKVAALGPKLRELAETESKKINAAYEFFSRKLKSSRKS